MNKFRKGEECLLDIEAFYKSRAFNLIDFPPNEWPITVTIEHAITKSYRVSHKKIRYLQRVAEKHLIKNTPMAKVIYGH